jgi:hypothetical protein
MFGAIGDDAFIDEIIKVLKILEWILFVKF